MVREFVIEPEAESDLEYAVHWYDDQRSGLGREFLECVESTFDRIRRNPDLHAITYRSARLALVPRFPFVIAYILDGDTVSVIAVFHGHRDPDTWQGRVS